jgi:hypothetical protein
LLHDESIQATNAQEEMNSELAKAEELLKGALDEVEPLMNSYNGLSGEVQRYSDQIEKIINKKEDLSAEDIAELNRLVLLRGELQEQISLRERLANARTLMSNDELDALLAGTPDAKMNISVTYGGLGRIPTSIREVNDALSEYSRMFDEANTPEQREQLRAMISVLEDLRSGFQGAGNGVTGMSTEISLGIELMRPAVDAFTSSFSQGLANIAIEGENAMRVLRNMGKYVLSATFQKLSTIFLTGGLASAGTGFFGDGGGLFGLLGFADGGRPPVGVPSIVGERGPELFVPDGPGTIIPNHKLGAGSMPTAARKEIVIHLKGELEGSYPKLIAQIQKTLRLYD